MGSSKSKSTTNETTNTVQTGTTTPSNPEWVTNSIQDWVGRIGAFGSRDPASFIAGASPLQQTAWANVPSLGEWRGQAAAASNGLNQIASMGANTAGPAAMAQRSYSNPAQWQMQQPMGQRPLAAKAGMMGQRPLGGGGTAAKGPTSVTNPDGSVTDRIGQRSGFLDINQSGFSTGPATAQVGKPPASVTNPDGSVTDRLNTGPRPEAPPPPPAPPEPITLYDHSQPNAPRTVADYQNLPGFGAPQAPVPPLAQPQQPQQAQPPVPSLAQGGPPPGYGPAQAGVTQTAMPGAVPTQQASGSTIAPTQQAGVNGYTAPQINPASLVQGQGYTAPQLGSAQGYAMARTSAPIGYSAAAVNTPGAISNQDISSFIGSFQNPWTDQVVNSSLATYDQGVAEQQARLAAQGARNGAFGGSRFGVAEGQLAADSALGRAQLGAGLRSQGFETALNAAAQQAGMNQQGEMMTAQLGAAADQFNANSLNNARQYFANVTNEGELDAARRYDASQQFNAGAQNQFSLAGAGLAADAAQFGATAANNAGLANQNALNSNNALQAQLAAQAGQFNAGAANTASMFNAGAANDRATAQAGMDLQNSQFNAGQANNMGLANAQLGANVGMFNAGQANDTSRFNAGQANQWGLAQDQLDAQLGMFNAGQSNDMARFNAGQGDNAANRALGAYGSMADIANMYGAGTRADLGLMGQLGDQQRQIEQAYAMAGPAQLEMMGRFLGGTPFDLFRGQSVNGTTNGTSSGTTTQTQSPSLFNMLLAGGSTVASLAPMLPAISDRRAKRDVQRVGTDASGLGLYRYRYLWDADDRTPRIGVMADEVAAIAPEGLGPVRGGFQTVDYGKLGLAHLTAS